MISVEKAAMAFDFKNCCTAEGQQFCCLNKNYIRTYSWLVYLKSRKAFIVNTVSYFLCLTVGELWGWEKIVKNMRN